MEKRRKEEIKYKRKRLCERGIKNERKGSLSRFK